MACKNKKRTFLNGYGDESTGIDNREAANAWLPGYIADYNRRFAVRAKDPQNAHLPYQGSTEALTCTLSVQGIKTLSKNLSCQHQARLMQVETSGTGLAMRGTAVTLHQHFDGTQELHWRKRKLDYTVMTKVQRQTPEADSKAVNERVDKVLAKCSKTNKGHKPAANHP